VPVPFSQSGSKPSNGAASKTHSTVEKPGIDADGGLPSKWQPKNATEAERSLPRTKSGAEFSAVTLSITLTELETKKSSRTDGLLWKIPRSMPNR
jgi:hypothetical protein